ncbi:hypothetical protein B0T17DRAFT_499101 [Bombardia bombarda]|uniref:Uncharacterized protein n=1 Tax=Bombardia bombarda TaxID=252184 RepID=A0AA39U7V4_9PEZI|nr:hypothetical protein B0T17DRAFT_499101 [Bombardia bombarda]
MQGIIKVAVAAALVAGVAADHHNHQHLHRHAKKHAKSPVAEKRADGGVVVYETVQATVVKYITPDGQQIDPEQAEQGISKGLYVVMGSSKPSSAPVVASLSTKTLSSSSTTTQRGGQFFEQKATSVSSSSSSSTSSSSSSSSTPVPSSSSSAKPEPSTSPVTGGGVDSDFPSGKVKCNTFPSDYGAVAIPWVGTGGWTTLASIGKWIKGASVDNIHSPITGTCSPGDMCSYACPPGYQKTQWPEDTQGATGQSVGGLWCNDDGYLELTRPSRTKLCEPGAGGVFVQNKLPGSAAVCRTDYPGNEAMTIPVETTPGSTFPLANPVSSEYYVWKGNPTTAQYYVNNMDVSVEEACTWTSSLFPTSAGNWAPTCIGVGKDSHGITYLSIFPNLPTSTAVLNFDIEIVGDVSDECWLKNGQYSKPNGCTVGIKDGGKATIIFKKSS